MSGYPTKENVEQFAKLLDEMAKRVEEIESIERDLGRYNSRLEDLQRKQVVTAGQRDKLLEVMDLRSTGNHGYEQRLMHLLLEIRTIPKKETR